MKKISWIWILLGAFLLTALLFLFAIYKGDTELSLKASEVLAPLAKKHDKISTPRETASSPNELAPMGSKLDNFKKEYFKEASLDLARISLEETQLPSQQIQIRLRIDNVLVHLSDLRGQWDSEGNFIKTAGWLPSLKNFSAQGFSEKLNTTLEQTIANEIHKKGGTDFAILQKDRLWSNEKNKVETLIPCEIFDIEFRDKNLIRNERWCLDSESGKIVFRKSLTRSTF